MSVRDLVKEHLFFFIAIGVLIAYLFPIYYFFTRGFMPMSAVWESPPKLIPQNVIFDHFKTLFQDYGFGIHMTRSLLVASSVTVISLALSITAGYGFSRYKIPGGKILTFGILGCRMVVPAALLAPLYKVLLWLNLLNTPWGIVIGDLTITLPLAIWIMITFLDEIPEELEEIAVIDGMSVWQRIRKVILPLIYPGIATAGFFSFVYGWTDYFFATSFGPSFKVASTSLASMVTSYEIKWGVLGAGSLIYTIPAIVIVFLFTEHIVRGLSATLTGM